MKIRVLIVDDEKDFANQLKERLLLRNYDTAVCFSGQEALERLENYNYDVVILDVSMPGVDGIETLRRIKQLKPLTEVIMLTGHATVESAIKGMKLGAYDYLLKPTDTELLLEKVNMAYQRKADQEERIRRAKADELFTSPRSVLKDD